MPNPSKRSSTTAQSSSSPSITVPVPAGVQNGDVLLTFFVMDKSGGVPTITTNPAWTLLNATHATGTSFEDVYGWVFFRIASSEPASYTWSQTNNDDTAAICVAIQDTNGATPVNAANVSSTDGTSMDAPSVTALSGDLLYCWWCGGRPGGWTTPGSMTQDQQANNPGAALWAYSVSAYESLVSSGATGVRTTTFGATTAWVAFSVLLTNAPAGTTYNESGAGGVVAGGAGADAQVMPESGAGGAIAGGASADSMTMVEAGDGGVISGGYGAVSLTMVEAGVGGAVAGGSGSAGITYTESGSGGVVAGGKGLDKHFKGIREPISVCQPPGEGFAYPFVDPSADIQKLLGDAYLAYVDELCQFVLPFHVAWLFGFGSNSVSPPPGFPTPVHAYDLVIKDAIGQTVFDSTQGSFVFTDWGNNLRVIEWIAGDQVCRVVKHMTFGPNDTPIVYDLYITPANGELDARTYRPYIGRVRSLRVSGGTKIQGKVQLVAGYNFASSVETPVIVDGGRSTQLVNIDANSGAGLGRFPGCGDHTGDILTINSIGADTAGNFILKADQCYRIDVPGRARTSHEPVTVVPTVPGLTTEQAKAALTIMNNCGQCCSCDMYAQVYQGINHVFKLWKQDFDILKGVYDKYMDNKKRWEKEAGCRSNISTRVLQIPIAKKTTFTAVTVCNTTKCCLADAQVRMTFVRYVNGTPVYTQPPGWQVGASVLLPGSGIETPLALDGSWPAYSMHAYGLSPNQSLTIKMKTVYSAGPNDVLHTYATTAAADPGTDCNMAEQSVPSELQSAWSAGGVGPMDNPIFGIGDAASSVKP